MEATRVNPKYVGKHFMLGNGVQLKITEQTKPKEVELLIVTFPDITIPVKVANEVTQSATSTVK